MRSYGRKIWWFVWTNSGAEFHSPIFNSVRVRQLQIAQFQQRKIDMCLVPLSKDHPWSIGSNGIKWQRLLPMRCVKLSQPKSVFDHVRYLVMRVATRGFWNFRCHPWASSKPPLPARVGVSEWPSRVWRGPGCCCWFSARDPHPKFGWT